jgi:hypothetical protein
MPPSVWKALERRRGFKPRRRFVIENRRILKYFIFFARNKTVHHARNFHPCTR